MEEQILAVDLSTEQTLEVNLPENDSVAQIDVYWQDEVVLDLDASLMYIVSGQQEIQDYVNNKSKPEIDEYIQDYAKPIVSEVVDQIATPVIDEYFENTVKPSITEFAEEEMAGYAATATTQAGIATEKANEASETAKIVDEKVQEFSQTIDASKTEFVNFAQQKTEEFEQTAITATEQAVGSAERSRIWAEGEQAEVEPLGGTLSSMGAADLAYAIANAPEDTPIDASGLFAMNVVKGEKGDKGDKGDDGKDGGGLEIGDVAFAVMGIDETKNLRRYLNGQVISQAQFVSFSNWVKERAKLYPNTVATEENWQAEVANSPYGICGKFVIDDTLGTIRLPKYPDWSVREVGQVPVVGNGMTLGLTNGINDVGITRVSGSSDTAYAAMISQNAYNKPVSSTAVGLTTQTGVFGVTTDPEKSGMIADLVNANTEDKLQGKWFIQVATGVEESVDVTREIELNNPFSLLDYKWSEYEISNASWLLSNGAFHSGTVYKAVYELLLKIHNGTETKDGVSVKLSTEEYSDTDFVINTADTTFRLPIKVANAPMGGTAPVITSNTEINTTGQAQLKFKTTENLHPTDTTGLVVTNDGGLRNRSGSVTTGSAYFTPSNLVADLSQATNDGLKLYFYVGETIQDANVINASGVLTRVAELSDSYISGLGMPSDRYIDLTLGASDSNYTAPANGWFQLIMKGDGSVKYISLNNDTTKIRSGVHTSATKGSYNFYVPAKKGDVVYLNYNTTNTSDSVFRFIYAEGE